MWLGPPSMNRKMHALGRGRAPPGRSGSPVGRGAPPGAGSSPSRSASASARSRRRRAGASRAGSAATLWGAGVSRRDLGRSCGPRSSRQGWSRGLARDRRRPPTRVGLRAASARQSQSVDVEELVAFSKAWQKSIQARQSTCRSVGSPALAEVRGRLVGRRRTAAAGRARRSSAGRGTRRPSASSSGSRGAAEGQAIGQGDPPVVVAGRPAEPAGERLGPVQGPGAVDQQQGLGGRDRHVPRRVLVEPSGASKASSSGSRRVPHDLGVDRPPRVGASRRSGRRSPGRARR